MWLEFLRGKIRAWGERAHIPSLDGIRGLAVLMVLLDHASDAEMRLFPGANLNRAGKYGVYLFFVLSAFLLTHLLSEQGLETLQRAKTWTNYLLRRFLRIFPLYAVVMVVLVVLGDLNSLDAINHLLLRDGQKQFWTIPVEVKFYLILPFVALVIASLACKKWLGAALSLAAGIAVTLAVVVGEKAWSLESSILLRKFLLTFLLGSLAAVVHGVLKKRTLGPGFLWAFEVLAIVALAASILRIPSLYNVVFSPEKAIGKFGNDEDVCGVLWSLFIVGVLHGTGYVRAFMSSLPWRYLGLISFSAYLWHEHFLSDVDDLPVPPAIRLLAYIALVVAISTGTYFLIERPLSRIRLAPPKPREASSTAL